MKALLLVVFAAAGWAQTITGNDRATADAFWSTYYSPAANPPNPGWTSRSQCDPGATSVEYQAVVLKRINYFRRMTGIQDLEIEPKFLSNVQNAAFMMSTNGTLNHHPPTTWTCYTPAGADGAARSNMGSGTTLSMVIDGQFMEDRTNNPNVGHRRYLLEPLMWKTATGHVPGELSGKLHYAAFYVVGAPQRATSMKFPFAGWPSPGYVPSQLVPKDWSFSIKGVDFNVSKPTVTVNGVKVTPAVTPMWVDTFIFAPAAATQYSVSVSYVAGGATKTIQYSVTPYSMAPPPSDFSVYTLFNSKGIPYRGQFITASGMDTASYNLVTGAGDTDNAKFAMEAGNVSFKGTSNLTAPAPNGAYSIRVRATTPNGQVLEKALQFP
ncbi:MAG: CAP domain-containing protein [Bryobacteraceae bacterium]